MKFFVPIMILLLSTSAFAKVEILPFKKNSWDQSWNEYVKESIEKDSHSVMLTSLDESDLSELGCPGFNSADSDSKIDFWIVFFSALTRSESAFNVKVKSIAPKGRHGNYGLLQLSKRTARDQCGIANPEDITEPKTHLSCGVKLMSWQLNGAPVKTNGRLLRPDLKNQLFGKKILLWGPLRQNDARGRNLLVGWFKKHLDQMPFCKMNS